MSKLRKYIISFIILIIAFSLLKYLCCLLPNDKINIHIGESIQRLESEGTYYLPFGNDESFFYKLDGFTDSLIFNISQQRGMKKGESNLKKAFSDSYYIKKGSGMIDSLSISHGNKKIYNNIQYSRYWHGSQVIIRVLLEFFNYSEIRMIFSIVIISLLCLCAILTSKNIGTLYSIALSISYCFIHIGLTNVSIQYSCILIISLLAVIATNLLCLTKRNHYFNLLMFLIGGCACYFDLLTFPLITLGLPALIMVIYYLKNDQKKAIKTLVLSSITWGAGYTLSFLSKWILSSIILNKNIVLSSLKEFLIRSDITGISHISKYESIKVNFNIFFNELCIKFLIIVFIGWIILFIKNHKKIKLLKRTVYILLLALYPYIWYGFLTQHSYIHSFFTNKIQMITLCSILFTFIYTLDENKVISFFRKEKVKCKHTFVILAYKESKYLEECIKSILNQSVKTNYVIVTSTPNKYISRLAKKYHIDIIEHKNSNGIADDFNNAVQCVNSNLVTIAHQDDIYEEDYAKNVIEFYQKYNKSIIIFTDYFEIRNKKYVYKNKNHTIKNLLLFSLRIKRFSGIKFNKRISIAFGNSICCPSVTFCKDNINTDKIFVSDFKCNMDWLAWERLSKLKGNFIYIKKPLMGHRVHEESTTTKIINSGIRTKEDYEMFIRFWPKTMAKFINKFYISSEKSNEVRR